MLRSIRDNIQGTWAKIILGLIIISFAFFGVESIRGGGGGATVLQVNGEKIEQAEFERERELLRRELLQQMGDDIDFSQLDDDKLAEPTLNRLTQRVLLNQAYADMGISAPEKLVEDSIMAIPSLQVDGRFSNERLSMFLSEVGMNLPLLKQRIAEEIQQNQFRLGVAASNFALPGEADTLVKILNESRVVTWVELPRESFASDIAINDSARQDYYEENKSAFMSEQQVVVEYIEMRLQDFVEPVDEERVQEEYQRLVQSHSATERRRVSHILLESEEPETAIEQLSAIRSEIEQGASFAELAMQHSQDPGSASEGGDLGYVEQDDPYPEAFKAAIFALELDQVSGPVQTDAGVHLVQLTAIDKEELPGFEEQSAAIRKQLETAEAEKVYVSRFEQLDDLVFNAESLDEPAEILNLEVKRSVPISRGGNDGLFADKRLVDQAFSADVMQDGLNSKIIELAADHSVVLRVLEVQEPRQLSLGEVKDIVDAAVSRREVQNRLQQAIEEIKTEVAGGAMLEEAAVKKGFSISLEQSLSRQSTEVDTGFLASLFTVSRTQIGTGQLQEFVSPAGDGFLYIVSSASEDGGPALGQEQISALEQTIRSTVGEQDYRSLVIQLNNKAEILRP